MFSWIRELASRRATPSVSWWKIKIKREIDEITDVTVHIDPEDDEHAPPSAHLPLRAEVLAGLASLWSNIPAATERTRIVLRYLGGAIDVDVYFPMATCTRPGADPVALQTSLKEALAWHAEFRGVRVFYG